MDNNQQRCSITVLNNGRQMETDFLNMVHEVVQVVIPDLPYDVSFTLRKMLGEELWELFVESETEKAGICMSHLVAMEAVDMEDAGRDVHNAKLYRRKRHDTSVA